MYMEIDIMKKMTTLITAVTLAIASTAASAWGWGDNGSNNGFGNGNGNGYGDGEMDGNFGFNMNFSGRGNGSGSNSYNGYNGYNGNNGYAPYGYGVPVTPAVEMTDEQKKAVADQQAQYLEHMQNAQKQAAEFYAAQPQQQFAYPGQDFRAQMEADHKARIAEMDARMEEFKKASDARRKAHQEAYKARLQERTAKVAVDTGA